MMDRDEFDQRFSNLMRDVFDHGGVELKRSFLPLSSDIVIQPAQFAQITTRPQLPFRGERLAVWSVCAPSFMIHDIRVANHVMGVSYGEVPADAFATRLDLLPMLDQQLDQDGFVQIKISKKADECFGQPIAMPLAMPGHTIIAQISNVSDRPQRFVSVILGDIHRVGLPDLP